LGLFIVVLKVRGTQSIGIIGTMESVGTPEFVTKYKQDSANVKFLRLDFWPEEV